MDARTLLDNLGTIADAPGGVDRLRELILDLAVRGQLVQQRESEGIASELVEKLESQRLRSSAGNRSRRQIDPVAGDEAPFTIPPTWTWVRLPAVSSDLGQGVPTQPFTYIDVGSIDNRVGSVGQTAVLSAEEAPSRARKSVARGSVVYSTVRPYLRNIALLDRDFDPPAIASTAFAVYTPLPGVLPIWVFHCLRSPYFTSYVEAHQKGVAYPAINDGDMRRAPLPLPPTGEQERIVAKVDELMQLCDDLEARKQARHDATTRLRASSLAALTNAETDDDRYTAWSRIHTNWEALTNYPDSIDALRSAILDLAARGLLVKQDHLEEPAEALIRRIHERRTQLRQGRASKATDLGPITSDEIPDAMPGGWVCERLGNVVEVVRGLTFPASAKQTAPGDGLVACLRTANVQDEVEWDDLIYVDESYVKHDRQFIRKGDILMSTANSRALVGKVALNKAHTMDVAFGGFVTVIRPIEIVPEFLMAVLRQPSTKDRLIDSATQTTNIANISMGRLRPLVIALPPLAEQKRIVAKLDSLMHLCDVLQSSHHVRGKIQHDVAASLCAVPA